MVKEYYYKTLRFGWFLLSLIIRSFTKVQKGQVMFWSTDFKTYGCNPMYISDYLLDNFSDAYTIYWVFHKPLKFTDIDSRIRKIKFGSLRYLYVINTSEFLITNHRTHARSIYWRKRNTQKYVMTWHGDMPIKKIEKDALNRLDFGYERFAKADSKNCDLMISDNEWFTNTIRRAFWYDGIILENGSPRNDIFFNIKKYEEVNFKVHNFFNIENDKMILLYAPTFRSNYELNLYQFEWSEIIDCLETKFNKEIVLLFRLHPTLLEKVNLSNEKIDMQFIDVSSYRDTQELLVASDILITDYSSMMFEFSMIKKPCFLLTKDINEYNRGFYCDFENLPFLIAKNKDDLVSQIMNCDMESYIDNVFKYTSDYFNPITNSSASKSFVNWMNSNRIQ